MKIVKLSIVLVALMVAGCVKPHLLKENEELRVELAKYKNTKPCQMPKGQPPFTLPMNGGVKYPDGFIYTCDEFGLRVRQDPLKHTAGVGMYSTWQSGGPLCKTRPTDTGDEICDEKRAREDGWRPEGER